MSQRTWRIIVGIVISNLAGSAFVGFMVLLTIIFPSERLPRDPYISTGLGFCYAAALFIIPPVTLGFVSMWFWRDLNLSRTGIWTSSATNMFFALMLCTLVAHEGVICLIMILPLLAVGVALGIALAQQMIRKNLNRLPVSIIPVFALIIIADTTSTQGYNGTVTDTLRINAPPAKVWQYIAGYPAITEPPDYWLWKTGLPAPLQSSVTGEKVGDIRKCVFTGGIALDERITAIEPGKRFDFDIISQPNHPEIIDHIILRKGQFILRNNGDGTTTMVGTSWYTLNVHPAIYFNLWTESIIRNVHMRVMRHIQTLAEAPLK